jgi:ABC-2 type transport system ATP-binding protein
VTTSRVSDRLVVDCRQVSKSFGATVALDRLDLAVERGTVTGFLGPNGAGKSTTLKVLVGLLRVDAGTCLVLDQDPRRCDPAVRRRIGYLPGELRLDERRTVDETLRSWARIRGGVDEGWRDQLCERLTLDTGRLVGELSSGNRRKVGLVGAFMPRPDLLLLDEPTGGLDPLIQATFADLVAEAQQRGQTVLLSSHVLSEVQRVADRIVVVRQGRAAFAGPVEELLVTARQPFLARFAGPPPEDELRAVAGVRELVIRGRDATGDVEGSPNPLLRTLARHDVERIVMPELDLEDAFLHLYEVPA